MAKQVDLTGQTFGKLTVIEPTNERVSKSVVWLCECSCENKTHVKLPAIVLRSGHNKSCGCLKTKHGAAKSVYKKGNKQLDYVLWGAMKNRCYSSNHNSYPNYGGKGIKVCDEWKDNFTCFAAYIRTLENCPDEEILTSRLFGSRIPRSIDRINSKGNYEPGNIKWSTKKEQVRNRGNTLKVNYNNETLPLANMIDKYSLHSYSQVFKRIHQFGWSIENALLKPLRGSRQKKLIRFKRKNNNDLSL